MIVLILFICITHGKLFDVDPSYPNEYNKDEVTRMNELNIRDYLNDNIGLTEKNLAVFIIKTTTSRLKYAEEIRKTWCDTKSQITYGFKCLFYYVEESVKENNNFKLLLSINETRKDIHFVDLPFLKEELLTLYQKTIATFIHCLQNFPDYYFYGAIDDETFVNIPVVIRFLNKIKNERRMVLGMFEQHSPFKTEGNRYYDRLAVAGQYPLFPTGKGFVLSKNITSFIGQWENYYITPPTSFDDTSVGFLMWKYSLQFKVPLNLFRFQEDSKYVFVHKKFLHFEATNNYLRKKNLA